MIQFPWWIASGVLCFAFSVSVPAASVEAKAGGNRLVYLDENDPFYPHVAFPKLSTPQWVGEAGVEAVVVLAIDDMRDTGKYEAYLRPILERLKRIDGRAPVSIMCNSIDPADPLLRQWLKEGLSLETHTLAHPCPMLAKSNFVAAAATYHDCIDLLSQVPGNRPVAFRMPCCDSMNSPSPRFYAEIFNHTSAGGHFLTIDTSVMNILSAKDPALPRELVVDADGREKFRKYVPFPGFATTIENYPYPYVIGDLCWEFPATVPSDWEPQHLHGTNNPVTVADWIAALDATVIKQGVFTMVFHPHGWIRSDQVVQFIEAAVQRHGSKVKFLNFQEADERLTRHLLAGQSLRDASGRDNGVRLIDLDNDGYLDVVVGNSKVRKTRVWSPAEERWRESGFPVNLVTQGENGEVEKAGAVFGIVHADGSPSLLVHSGAPRDPARAGRQAWRFDGQRWVEAKNLWTGLEIDGEAVFTSQHGRDRGVRFRDIDLDGRCELITGNPSQNAVFAWSEEEGAWNRLPYALPDGTAIVNAQGQDAGLRFIDINEDGYDDVLFSDERRYSLHLFVPKLFLGFGAGWSREVLSGRRGDPGEIPMIVRSGTERNNGAWFHSRRLWVQNEDTAAMPDVVDRRSYDELLGGFLPQAKSPEASLRCMRVRPGFKVELVASEPLVQDPIAFEWGEDGRLWVVEMGDYPTGIDGAGRPGGVVRFLEDRDGDGRYDTSTVFLEHLNFPTGVMPWRKGVLVSAAPEVFYAEDQDGDGKADLKRTLLKGFNEGNQQHRVNGFEFGLDNWIYGANGDSGGKIVWVEHTPGNDLSPGVEGKGGPYELRGHDFRFKPDEGLFETVAGQTQFGRRRDDWGNWFGNNNPAWLWHFVYPTHYLARNPDLAVRSVKRYLADYPDGTRVHPVSRSLQRFNDIAMLNHVTSANSPTPYRDNVFGPEFATSVFISEPVHNAVHREVLEPDAVSFTSHRASDEEQREFLASTDNWFRPVMLKTGPNGALYVADMYRLVLEHPEWIPADTLKQLDLRAGADKGRIYRVYPEGASLRPIPRLSDLGPVELASCIESPNGWIRDTAQRLLVHGRAEEAVPKLKDIVQNSDNPKGRLQALCTLDGLGCLTPDILCAALADSHSAVRQQAVRLSEPFLQDKTTEANAAARESLLHALLRKIDDPAPPVRFQLAFTLGDWKEERAGIALARLGMGYTKSPEMLTAVLSSAVPHVRSMLDILLREAQGAPPVELVGPLLAMAVSANDSETVAGSVRRIAQPASGGYARWQFAAANGFLDGVERKAGSWSQFEAEASPRLREALEQFEELLDKAKEIALSPSAPEADRLASIPLLGRAADSDSDDLGALLDLLGPQVAAPLQQAALDRFRQVRNPKAAGLLLQGWRSYPPSLRTAVLAVLLGRGEWTERLLDAIEAGTVTAAQISPQDRQKMLGHSREAVRTRARRLFALEGDRRRLLEEYQDVLAETGDKNRGAEVFRQNCATCHRFRDEGFGVGPDLGALANKAPRALLIAILDPNQAVEARYVNFTAVTEGEREISGIIVAETTGSVTLRGANGTEETVLRSDIREFYGAGVSLMPEGFERTMTRGELADLIVYLTSLD